MLKFYVVSASRDTVNDTDRSTTCRSRARAPPLHREVQKNEGLYEKMGYLSENLITV